MTELSRYEELKKKTELYRQAAVNHFHVGNEASMWLALLIYAESLYDLKLEILSRQSPEKDRQRMLWRHLGNLHRAKATVPELFNRHGFPNYSTAINKILNSFIRRAKEDLADLKGSRNVKF